MLTVKKLVVGSLSTNCYLVYEDNSKKCLVVDPGDDADFILRVIADLQLVPEKIVATHGHFDHILATTELKLSLNVPFLLHKKDEFLLSYMKSSAKHFLGIESDPPPEIDMFLDDLKILYLGNSAIKIIHTPGHTPGSVSLYNKEGAFSFVGDLLFMGGSLGRTDFSYADGNDLRKSVEKVLCLPSETHVYSGHGEETSVREERKYRKLFLRN